MVPGCLLGGLVQKEWVQVLMMLEERGSKQVLMMGGQALKQMQMLLEERQSK
jgi:hypothetical protein